MSLIKKEWSVSLLFLLVSGCTEDPAPRDPGPKGDGPVVISGDAAVAKDAPTGDHGVTADQPITTVEHDCADPAAEWLLCEDFERGDGDFDTWLAGSEFNAGVGLDDRGRVTLDTEQIHGGGHALYMPAAASANYQGANLGWRKCQGPQKEGCDGAMASYEELHMRAWVRFAPDHKVVHHFLNIGGSQPDRFYSLGSSGCRRAGVHSMGATVDSKEDTHHTFFYTYHPEMSCGPDCVSYMGQQWVEGNCAHCTDIGMPTCEDQLQCCWGDEYAPDPPVAFPVGQWFCFEMMVKANTPNQHDGVMAYWIDGQLGHQVDDMMWRTVPELALNRASLQHYNETEDVGGHSNKAWFDDVVVSTARIGCGQ